ncbi:MAG TPA: hypothetical protein VNH64_10885, partial [Parvularculaceae bacterium]|nr:hypothetical protein [Parvularculaceae bacterium]
DNGFGKVAAQLSKTNEQLAEIIKLLESPAEVAGAEQARAGLLAFHNSLWPEAKAKFRSAIDHFDLAPVPWLYLGSIAFYVDGELDEADGFLNNAVKYGKLRRETYFYSAEALLERAWIAFAKGDKERCGGYAREALILLPHDIYVLVQASRCFVASEKKELAIRALCLAFDLEPRSVLALVFPWTKPIQKEAVKWLNERHQEEFAPLVKVGDEILSIQKNAESNGFNLRAWAGAAKPAHLLNEMKRGYLDLRLNATSYVERVKKLAVNVKQEMDKKIGDSRTNFFGFSWTLLSNMDKVFLVVGIWVSVLLFLFLPFAYPEASYVSTILGLFWWAGWILIIGLGLVGVFGLLIGDDDSAKAGSFWVLVIGGGAMYGIYWFLNSLHNAGIPYTMVVLSGPVILGMVAIAGLYRFIRASNDRRRLGDTASRTWQVLSPLVRRLEELHDRTLPALLPSLQRQIDQRVASVSFNASRVARTLSSMWRALPGRRNISARRSRRSATSAAGFTTT